MKNKHKEKRDRHRETLKEANMRNKHKEIYIERDRNRKTSTKRAVLKETQKERC